MSKTRQPAVAGMFYPSDKNKLTSMIDEFIDHAVEPAIEGDLKGIIVPHAGYIYSGIVAAAGFKLLKSLGSPAGSAAGGAGGAKKPKILLIGPAHTVMLNGAAVPKADAWKTPLGTVQVKSLLDEIGDSEVIFPSDEPMAQEHSLEVQVPFLQRVLNDFDLYPLCTGNLNPEFLAKELEKFVKRDDVIVVVSSDLSHYYTYDEAKHLDDFANKYIPRAAVSEVHDRVEACGIDGILTLLHMADMLGLKGHFVDYKNSGDTAGDKSQVVGYGCYAFTK